MTEMAFCVLMALTRVAQARYQEIAEISGYSRQGMHNLLPYLIQRGCVHKPCHGQFQITERGKIALAIEVGKRTRVRAERHGKRLAAAAREMWSA